MSLISRLMDLTRLNDDDDEDYFGPEDDYEQDMPGRRNTFSNSRDDMDEEEDEEPRPRFFSRSSSKVVPMRKPMQVAMVKPTSIEDARDICDFLLADKAIVLNMEGIHTEVAQRIIDFTSGATYSMNGNLQKISSYIFIATPESVELSGDFQDIFTNGNMDVTGMNIRL